MRIDWNSEGFRRLLTAPGVQADLFERSQRMARACGEGFVAEDSTPARTRARSAVIAVSAEARRRNASENVLLRNLGAAR